MRKKKYGDKYQISFYVSPEMFSAIEKQAEKEGPSISNFVRTTVERRINEEIRGNDDI